VEGVSTSAAYTGQESTPRRAILSKGFANDKLTAITIPFFGHALGNGAQSWMDGTKEQVWLQFGGVLGIFFFQFFFLS